MLNDKYDEIVMLRLVDACCEHLLLGRICGSEVYQVYFYQVYFAVGDELDFNVVQHFKLRNKTLLLAEA